MQQFHHGLFTFQASSRRRARVVPAYLGNNQNSHYKYLPTIVKIPSCASTLEPK